MYVCTTCIPSDHRGQKKASDSLGLALQIVMVMSCHVNAGIELGSSERASILNHGANSLYSWKTTYAISFILFLTQGAGEMAQRVRAPTALPKVMSSNPSTHVVAHNHP